MFIIGNGLEAHRGFMIYLVPRLIPTYLRGDFGLVEDEVEGAEPDSSGVNASIHISNLRELKGCGMLTEL